MLAKLSSVWHKWHWKVIFSLFFAWSKFAQNAKVKFKQKEKKEVKNVQSSEIEGKKRKETKEFMWLNLTKRK